jgi:hypothetical protein
MNAATYNVRFSAQLLRAGLLFDERLGSSGGEDTDFFVRGRKVGFEIRKISTAITREHTHPERLTYRGQIYRAYWKAVADMKRIRLEGGSTGLIWRRAHTIPLQMISGLAHLCIGITAGAVSLLRPSSKHRLLAIYKRRALRGGRKIAKSAGRLAAMVGHDPQPYRTIHGE